MCQELFNSNVLVAGDVGLNICRWGIAKDQQKGGIGLNIYYLPLLKVGLVSDFV